jgi:hypothetical protein
VLPPLAVGVLPPVLFTVPPCPIGTGVLSAGEQPLNHAGANSTAP